MNSPLLARISGWTFRLQQRAIESALTRSGLERIGGHIARIEKGEKPWFVVDLGANRGRFLDAISDRRPCSCLAVEANPALCAPLRVRYPVVHAAIAPHDGTIELQVSANSETTSMHAAVADRYGIIGQAVVPAVTFRTLRRSIAKCPIDFLKVDVEGGETALFSDLDQKLWDDVRQMSVEFHDHILTFPPKEQTAYLLRGLRRLGFVSLVLSTPTDYREVFLYHPERVQFSLRQRWWLGILQHVVLNLAHVRGFIARRRSGGRH